MELPRHKVKNKKVKSTPLKDNPPPSKKRKKIHFNYKKIKKKSPTKFLSIQN
jgi:hypothetical protein